MSSITVQAPESDGMLEAFGAGALLRLESSATFGGSFSETGTAALVQGTTAYSFTASATGSWYRTRYSDAGSANFSDYSDEFQSDPQPNLVSLDEVKLALGIDDTDDDELLTQYIGEVADEIRDRTSQDFLQFSGVRTFDGLSSWDGSALVIQGGIQSVSLLEIAIFTTGSFYTMPASVYFLRPHPYNRRPGWPAYRIQMTDYTLISTVAPVFYAGMDNIRVTGVFGWPAVPKGIKAVAKRAVVNAWRMKGSGGTGDTFQVGVDGQRQFSRYFSLDDIKILRRYSNEPLVVA